MKKAFLLFSVLLFSILTVLNLNLAGNDFSSHKLSKQNLTLIELNAFAQAPSEGCVWHCSGGLACWEVCTFISTLEWCESSNQYITRCRVGGQGCDIGFQQIC